jgi:uncharacterized protein YqgC (DUF456 family)
VTSLYWIIACLLVFLGVAGIVLPALPGTLLVAAGLFLAAWIDDFSRVGWFPLLLIAFLVLLSYAVDLLFATLGTKKAGASRWAIAGAGIGMVVGMFFGLPGILLGPFAGAFLAETLRGRKPSEAGKAGMGALAGVLVGTLVKLGIVMTMVGVFALAYFL